MINRKLNPYAQINRSILEDPNLSWGAKGMLCYLLSKNEDWLAKISDLKQLSLESKPTTKRIIKELIEAGYVERVTTRALNGQIVGVEYLFHEEGGAK